jgi:hypothetical protein
VLYKWAVAIGRFNIQTAVMTLSGFCRAPSTKALTLGHGQEALPIRVCRVCTDEPDYSDTSDFEYDWSNTVYG